MKEYQPVVDLEVPDAETTGEHSLDHIPHDTRPLLDHVAWHLREDGAPTKLFLLVVEQAEVEPVIYQLDCLHQEPGDRFASLKKEKEFMIKLSQLGRKNEL